LLRICAETYKPYSQQKTRFYAGLCAFSGRLQIVLEALLFSNTESSKSAISRFLSSFNTTHLFAMGTNLGTDFGVILCQ